MQSDMYMRMLVRVNYALIRTFLNFFAHTVKFMVLPEGFGSTGLYQYFIKVVPTVFSDGNKRKLHTNQYTFTERFRPLMLPDPTSGLLTAVRQHTALCIISQIYSIRQISFF